MAASEAPTQAAPTAVLLDLLMAVMDSPATWVAAAGDPALGMVWRDDVTERMRRARRYEPYDALVGAAATTLGLPRGAMELLRHEWRRMRPRPDATAVAALPLPYAFVTNCSSKLARQAAQQSGLSPRFTLSAEAAGWYKPSPQVYRRACDRFGSPPDETLFIAGAAYDAEGALAAGLRAVLVRRRPLTHALSPQIPVVDSLDAALRDAL